MRAVRPHAWLLVLVVGVVLFEVLRRTLVATDNPNLIPALLLLGAATVPVTFVVFIRGRRLDYSVGGGTVALVALVGGVVGVATAGILEYDVLHDLGALPSAGVGLIEEAAKLIAPLAVLIFTRYRRPADGLLAGVASGAGFAALETMGYAFVTLVNSQGNLAAVDGILLIRGLLSPAAHMAWTGLTAAALFSAAAQQWSTAAIGRLIATYLVAAGLHAAWDGIGGILAYVVIGVISLGLLTVTAHRFAVDDRREHGALLTA